MNDQELVTTIAKAIHAHGGRVMFVGGYARDTILRKIGQNVASKDIDVEVYGVPLEQLQKLLAKYAAIDTVGASFGVIKLKNTNIDVSIPRRDSKLGVGHKGFIIDTDPHMSVQEAARRRDFTINTLAIDVLTGEVADYYNGTADLKAGILRATDHTLFADDPLRVLRAMQFAARFNMRISDDTIKLCRTLNLHELPRERIDEEWKKLLLKSTQPSIGLEAAKTLGILDQLHPELAALIDTPQDPRWHPEGSVWEHTKLAVDIGAQIIRRDNLDERSALELMLAILCHDLGKATTTTTSNTGAITSYGHETAGLAPLTDFLTQLAISNDLTTNITALVANHMLPLTNRTPSDTALRRLANRLYPATITQLLRLAEADICGRAGAIPDTSHLATIAERAAILHVANNKPQPIILGRDLLALGVQPGLVMGGILDQLFERQLAGAFSDHKGGIILAKQYVRK